MKLSTVRQVVVENRAVFPVLLVAGILLGYGITNVRPHLMVVDAHWAVLWALKRGANRTLFIPTFFKGGNLHINLLSAVFVPVYLILLATGKFDYNAIASASSLSDESNAIYAVWDLSDAFLDIYYQFFIAARLVSAMFALCTIVLVYMIGKYIQSKRAGVLAALATSVSMGFIHVGHFATEDMVMTFFIIFTIFALTLFRRRKEARWLRYGAIGFGLAVSSKAIAGVLLLPVIYAHLTDNRLIPQGYLDSFFSLTKSGLLTIAAYLVTTPSILVYPMVFYRDLFGSDIAYIYGQYATGAPPLMHPGWIVHGLNLARAVGLPLFLFIILATGWSFRRQLQGEREVLTEHVFLFIIPYFIIVGTWNTDALYYVIPLVPLLTLFAGRYADVLLSNAEIRHVVAPVLAAILVFSLIYTGLAVSQIANDSREDAAAWMNASLEPGSEVDVYTHVMNRPVLPSDVAVTELQDANWSTRNARIDQQEARYIVIVSNQYEGCFQHKGRETCKNFYRKLANGKQKYDVIKTFNGPIQFEYSLQRRVLDTIIPDTMHPVDPTIVVLERQKANKDRENTESNSNSLITARCQAIRPKECRKEGIS